MIKRLGFGGFGKVYLLRNKATKELRAAKHQVRRKNFTFNDCGHYNTKGWETLVWGDQMPQRPEGTFSL